MTMGYANDLITAVTALSLTGCVTTHYGDTREQAGLMTSCHEDWDFETSKYRLIRCTFENKRDLPITTKVEGIRFSDTYHRSRGPTQKPVLVDRVEERGVLIAYTQTVHDRAEATQVWAPIIVGLTTAAVIGASSRSSGSSSGALADGLLTGAVVGGATALSDDDEIEAHKQAELDQVGQMRDDNRIDGQPFVVPTGLYVRRHAMLRLDAEAPLPCSVELCFSQPAKRCVSMELVPAQAPRSTCSTK